MFRVLISSILSLINVGLRVVTSAGCEDAGSKEAVITLNLKRWITLRVEHTANLINQDSDNRAELLWVERSPCVGMPVAGRARRVRITSEFETTEHLQEQR